VAKRAERHGRTSRRGRDLEGPRRLAAAQTWLLLGRLHRAGACTLDLWNECGSYGTMEPPDVPEVRARRGRAPPLAAALGCAHARNRTQGETGFTRTPSISGCNVP